ncbi:hypothetical protein PVAND_015649 [Polypedilum vanderplanki]|uniref:Hemolymph juvenile hormone binding protein n=1 Tax=Polypedilum vanderplanki TaxID=319348 RepID=A0A9J6BD65_POLVA|nr:hypothetical protein PVAND_015649 [Polypedilum vanderplanki]
MRKYSRNILIFLLLFVFVNFSHEKLPKTIEVCSRKNPKLNQCIIDSIKKIQPYLGSGKLDNEFQITPLEPFAYEGFLINPAHNFNAKVSDVKVYGSSNFTIEKLRFNIDTLVLDMILQFPKLTLIGKYEMKAKISILDIVGNGDLETINYNSRMRTRAIGKIGEKDQQVYVDKVNVKIQPGSSTNKLTNLFNGDPLLQDIGNQLINENQDIFLEYIIPIMEKQFGNVLKSVSNQIISNATFDELFPDKIV